MILNLVLIGLDNRPVQVNEGFLQNPLLPGSPGDFSFGRIEVKTPAVEVDVGDEPLFVPVSVRFLDQSLNFVVESFQGAIADRKSVV